MGVIRQMPTKASNGEGGVRLLFAWGLIDFHDSFRFIFSNVM